MRLGDLLFRVKTLLTIRSAERELNEELSFHLAMERDKLERAGRSASQADAEAQTKLGGVTRERQRARDQWGIGALRDFAGDVRHAFRQFRRRPVFTLTGTLTLAIGIGATVSLFSVVRGMLLRPLPYTNERSLSIFWHDYDWTGAEFDFVHPLATAFTDVAAYSINGYTLTAGDGAVTTLAGVVTANAFDVLGSAPALGRTFAMGDDRPGAEPRVVLSDHLWKRTFGADSAIVGKRVTLDGQQVTVIGVMPKRFYFPTPEIDMWRPANMDPSQQFYAGNGWFVLFGRTKPGSSAADVNHNLQSIATALGKRFTYAKAWDKSKDAHITPLREYLMGNVRPALLLLLGAVVALLLMACANVAALILSRTADRAPEMNLRLALGAGRGRLARQIIAESLALSAVSGALGAVLGATTFTLLVRKMPLRDGLGTTLGVDWWLFLGAIVLAGVVGLAVAAAPVRSVLMGQLKGIGGERSAAGVRGGHKRFHFAMVAVEMTLGVTLAAGALMLVRSVSNLYGQKTGFDPHGVVTLDVLISRDIQGDSRAQFFDDLEQRARALPTVTGVGYVNRLPVRDGGWQTTFQSKSRPDIPVASAPTTFFRVADPGYFGAMNIAIVRGRNFNETDRADAPGVVIVSESFAKKFWPGQDPIGQFIAPARATNPTWLQVIGVAAETRLFRMVGENQIAMYQPLAQSGAQSSMVMVVRTSGSKDAAMAALRGVVRDADRRAAVGSVISMDNVMAVALSDQLQLRFFLTLFATLALVLGAIGVYGVVSYAVSRRRAEFGVRLALGATSGRVLREVAAGGLRPVAYGIAAGVVASVLLSRFVTKFLFGVTPHDALSIGGAAAVLLLAGAAAVIVPGARAGRTSPAEALREE